MNGIYIPAGQDLESANEASSSYQGNAIIDILTPENLNVCDSELEEVDNPPKKRRNHQNFIYEKSFANEKDAMEEIAAEKCWSKHYQNNSSVGKRIKFRCNQVKFRGSQCAASIFIILDPRTPQVHLHRAEDAHDHEENVNLIVEISRETKEAISQMFDLGITRPKKILDTLMVKGLVLPDRKLFDSYLKKLRKDSYGADKIDMNGLKTYLSNNTSIPVSKSDMYVVDFQMSMNEIAPSFQFFVSSRQLLSLAINAKNIHADATYKLIWQGFPVLLVGTTDMHRKFHAFGIAVCTSETAQDFQFLFAAVKKGVHSLFNINFVPKALICDAVHSIHNAFKEEFGDERVIIMCWAHMRRKIVEKTRTHIHDKQHQIRVTNDIDKLQLSSSNQVFDQAAKLFVLKWKDLYPEFVEYFDVEWLKKIVFGMKELCH